MCRIGSKSNQPSSDSPSFSFILFSSSAVYYSADTRCSARLQCQHETLHQTAELTHGSPDQSAARRMPIVGCVLVRALHGESDWYPNLPNSLAYTLYSATLLHVHQRFGLSPQPIPTVRGLTMGFGRLPAGGWPTDHSFAGCHMFSHDPL